MLGVRTTYDLKTSIVVAEDKALNPLNLQVPYPGVGPTGPSFIKPEDENITPGP